MTSHRRPHQAVVAVVALVGVLAGALGALPAAAADHGVGVHSDFYDPKELRIERGDSVTWTWVNGGHTVTSKTGAFRSGTLAAGGRFTVPFPDPGTYQYGCDVHGSMTGTIQVGEPTGPPPPIEAPKLYVPTDVPTLEEAVARARPGTEVVLEGAASPVRLTRPIVVATAGLTVTTGTRPVATSSSTTTTARKAKKMEVSTTTTPPPPPPPPIVTIERDGDVTWAFDILASGVTLERLAIGDFVDGAIRVKDATTVRLRALQLSGGRDYGILAEGSNVAVTEVEATGYRRAGVAFRSCDDCGIVTALAASGNFVGFEALDASGVVLRSSSIHDNANGVIVQTRHGAAAGADLLGNLVVDNDRTDVRSPTVFDGAVQPAAGVGVWLAGARQSQVRENVVEGHRWGIVASVLGGAATDDRITDNRAGRSTQADLAWDGVGTGTCFARNTATTVHPAVLEAIYGCNDAVPTVGVPDPTVSGDIVLSSLTTYYCRELIDC